MANTLSGEDISRIRTMASEGNSLRKISRDLGISTNTVSKYGKGHFGLCKCGLPSGHRGWCKERYKASESRQAFHAKRKGVVLPVREAPIKSRQQSAKAEKQFWTTMPRRLARPLPTGLHFRAIGDVTHACRNIRVPEKEDVVQHMILSVIDGFLPFEDIPRAIPTFIGFHMRDFVFAFSIDDTADGERSFAGMFSEDEVRDRWDDLAVGVGVPRERRTRRMEQIERMSLVASTHSR